MTPAAPNVQLNKGPMGATEHGVSGLNQRIGCLHLTAFDTGVQAGVVTILVSTAAIELGLVMPTAYQVCPPSVVMLTGTCTSNCTSGLKPAGKPDVHRKSWYAALCTCDQTCGFCSSLR